MAFNTHTQDYPSVGQIRQKLREYDIIPLFAAERSATQFYTVSDHNKNGYIKTSIN